MDGDRILNAFEASDYLRLTPRALYAAAQRRQLPVIKMGKRVRFRQRDLDAWLEAQTLQPLNPRSNREGGAA